MRFEEIQATLKQVGIENARWEATLLVEKFGSDVPNAIVARRCSGYPLQYILGEWDFYKETYEVNESCLIPRSDTEILVEQAIKMLPNGARFVDLCTGSGCVAISTLASRGDTAAVAVELFPGTLQLAHRNAQKNGVAARFFPLQADVLQAPPDALPRGSFDAILSNPPYINNDVVPTLQREVGFEPAAALCGGADGLDFYRAILEKWLCLLKPAGLVLFEIGYDQGDALRGLGKAAGFAVDILQDYGKNDRVAVLKAPGRD